MKTQIIKTQVLPNYMVAATIIEEGEKFEDLLSYAELLPYTESRLGEVDQYREIEDHTGAVVSDYYKSN